MSFHCYLFFVIWVDDIIQVSLERQAYQDQDQQKTRRKDVFLVAEGFQHEKSNYRLQINRQYTSIDLDKYYDVETFYHLIDKFYNSQVEIVEGSEQA